MTNIKKQPVIAKILFGRSLIVGILVLLQMLIIFGGFLWFYDIIEYMIGGYTITGFILIIWIINNKSNPAFKLAWILPILLFPIVGGFFYLFVETNLGGRKFRKRVKSIIDKTSNHLNTDESVAKQLENRTLKNLATYVNNTSGFPIYCNTAVQYLPMGEIKFAQMKDQLCQAKDFIFLEYFIVDEGRMWNEILEILMKKVKENVEVRVLYDGLGTLLTLPEGYDKFLREQGIKAKVFSPVLPLVSTHQNNRDHRKILVIDGTVAFNGGVNLADEYINEKSVYGHWKDVAVMLEGNAVKSYTLMFLQMWNIDEKQPDDYFRYFPNQIFPQTSGYVMPYCDNPLTSHRIGETIYMDMIYKAQNYVHIMTPYLIIDNEMLTALTVAATSGIDVKIIMPHIPDKQIPFDIARSFYPTLIQSGVKIYEYTEGFVHAKVFVCDNRKAVVGTINMDYRSLYHHFECATYMEDITEIIDIENDFIQTLQKCHKFTIEDYKKLSLIRRVSGRVFRLIAPLV